MNIGQAAEAAGVNAKMIRYYESIGLISAASRTDAGYRQYNEKDIRTLRFIRRSRELGFSIERIKTLLSLWEDRGRKSSDVKELAGKYIAELDRDIEKLQSIRSQLQHLADCCHGDHRPDCPIIEDLAAGLRH
ncbi:Cu(I)-responsive transcriptional regulator [Noviherbaspirillum suwonense]|jgi:MerR family copper efflux transcriptional regulator|uniref:MerR family transcriptional regulator, copper efflux regulator n=1 Tax=Noviherbaspirillum suwonense TaxID=1224511 RepID=A0ABY1PZ75_9BURK|nr:Cu(I)-responsive transcriptional regulator [Noviherbaspirillum suwonense]SMP51520.1 MerR family transcriptional regulator, copper efflux regulator [Noviherbaspirillum suwonense]